MKRSIISMFLLVVVIVFTITACAPARSVQRVSADEQIDLSGRWNANDSQLVAQQMINDVLSRPWLSNFQSQERTQPVVIVGTVRNLSSEHIDTATFIKNMERELINSGQVRFVAGSEAREEVRQERLDQQYQATDETAARLAAETGANYMLQGAIRTIIDTADGQQVRFYQVDLELVDIERNEKVWMGNKEIKKYISRSRNKW